MNMNAEILQCLRDNFITVPEWQMIDDLKECFPHSAVVHFINTYKDTTFLSVSEWPYSVNFFKTLICKMTASTMEII